MKIEIYESKKQKKEQTGSFTLDWVQTLGWEENPFAIQEPAIAGMERERQEINLFFIKQKSYGVITGKSGTGKSMLLLWLIRELERYKELKATHIHGSRISSEDDLRIQIAAPYRGVFTKKNELSTQELIEKIDKKEKRRHVLLIDDADHLPEGSTDILYSLLKRGTVVLASAEKSVVIDAKDQLQLKLGKPSADEFIKILHSRIVSVGGEGILPFNEEQVKKLAKSTDNTQEFLDMAAEIAIDLALKNITHDTPQKVEPKKKSGKREYDDLIESLTEDI